MTEHVEQPMPTPNNSPSIQALVREDLAAREQVGISRYGTSLQAHNGRDSLRDGYEEAMDLTVYIRQIIAERDNPTTWSMPAEPGPEVLALRDGAGCLWTRNPEADGGGWCCDAAFNGEPAPWYVVLADEPLTDATHELDATGGHA